MDKKPIREEIVEPFHVERFGLVLERLRELSKPAGKFAVTPPVLGEGGITAAAHHRFLAGEMNANVAQQFIEDIGYGLIVISGQRHEMQAVEEIDEPLVIAVNGGIAKTHVLFPMK